MLRALHGLGGRSRLWRVVVDSAGSKRRQNFVVGNGQRVPNEGQLVLNLEGDLGLNGGKRTMNSTFRVAEVIRPLMSVSRAECATRA